MMKAVIVIAFVLCATCALHASANEQSFKRERRAGESSQLILESLREELVVHASGIVAVTNGLRDVATQNSVYTLQGNVAALSNAVDNLVDASTLDGMVSSVQNALVIATSAAVVTAGVNNDLPSLRQRSEAGLKATVSLLNEFPEDEASVTEFENTYYSAAMVNNNNMFTVEANINRYVDRTNFTAQTDTLLSRSDVLLSLAEAFDQDKYDAIVSNLALTATTNNNVPIIRWNIWSTYDYGYGWYAGNSNTYYGGVAPSTWSNSNGYASQMSTDMNIIRTLFPHKMWPGVNAVIWAREWQYTSSTNGRHTGALLRIRNSTPNNIGWTIYVYQSSYGGWEEGFSMTFNGNNIYQSNPNCWSCTRSAGMTFPPNTINTVIVVSGSSSASGTRTALLGFYNNCLNLPTGLEWVDDLTEATGLQQAVE